MLDELRDALVNLLHVHAALALVVDWLVFSVPFRSMRVVLGVAAAPVLLPVLWPFHTLLEHRCDDVWGLLGRAGRRHDHERELETASLGVVDPADTARGCFQAGSGSDPFCAATRKHAWNKEVGQAP